MLNYSYTYFSIISVFICEVELKRVNVYFSWADPEGGWVGAGSGPFPPGNMFPLKYLYGPPLRSNWKGSKCFWKEVHTTLYKTH